MFNQSSKEKKSHTEQSEKYLAIYLNHTKVQAALWQVINGKIQITTRSDVHFFKDQESCLVKTDEALQELGKDSEGVSEVVFGLNDDWMEKGDLADAKKPILKKLTQDLSLKPVGYVVMTEALAKYLSADEPLTSLLLVELTEQELVVNLLQRGAITLTQRVGKSDDLVADLNESLARVGQNIGQEHLPPKILVYSLVLSEAELAEGKQLLLSCDWTKDHAFLYPPVIETLESHFVIDAITKQGGQAVAEAKGLQLATNEEATTRDLAGKNVVSSQAEDFGFAEVEQDTDLAVSKDDDNLAIVNHQVAHDFGFEETAVEQPVGTEHKDDSAKKPVEKVTSFLVKKERELSHKPFMVTGFLGGIVVLLIIGLVTLFMSRKAIIEVTLKAKLISQAAELELDPAATQPDADNLILPANLTTKQVAASDTVETNGVKLIGDKAFGKITIYNKTDSEKKFESGTILTSGELQFTLNDEVSVASASVEIDSGSETKTFGKADAQVTAQQIGADSNIAAETELKIASFAGSSYVAEVAEDLSGGSSREIRVVSATDMANLKEALTKTIKEQAAEDFKNDSGDGVYYVPTQNIEVVESNFDAEEGDEVETLSLDLTLNIEAVSYKVDDLKPLAESLLASQVPDNYKLSQEDPQILSTPSEQAEQKESTNVILAAQISSKAIPVVDADSWKHELAGQSLSSAEAILRGKGEVKDFKIMLLPKLAGHLLKSIPNKAEQIDIKLQ